MVDDRHKLDNTSARWQGKDIKRGDLPSEISMDILVRYLKVGDVENITSIIEHDGDAINFVDYRNGFSALHYAALAANDELILFLIDNRAPAHHKDYRGRLAIQLCVGLIKDETMKAFDRHTFPWIYEPRSVAGPHPKTP